MLARPAFVLSRDVYFLLSVLNTKYSIKDKYSHLITHLASERK